MAVLQASALSELRLAKEGLDFRRRDLEDARKRLRTTQRRLAAACEAWAPGPASGGGEGGLAEGLPGRACWPTGRAPSPRSVPTELGSSSRNE